MNNIKATTKLGLAISVVLLLVTGCSGSPHQREQETPPYDGGPAIIFRMDGEAKGFHKEAVEQIIKLFEENNVPPR